MTALPLPVADDYSGVIFKNENGMVQILSSYFIISALGLKNNVYVLNKQYGWKSLPTV